MTTKTTIALADLVENGADSDLLVSVRRTPP